MFICTHLEDPGLTAAVAGVLRADGLDLRSSRGTRHLAHRLVARLSAEGIADLRHRRAASLRWPAGCAAVDVEVAPVVAWLIRMGIEVAAACADSPDWLWTEEEEEEELPTPKMHVGFEGDSAKFIIYSLVREMREANIRGVEVLWATDEDVQAYLGWDAVDTSLFVQLLTRLHLHDVQAGRGEALTPKEVDDADFAYFDQLLKWTEIEMPGPGCTVGKEMLP